MGDSRRSTAGEPDPPASMPSLWDLRRGTEAAARAVHRTLRAAPDVRRAAAVAALDAALGELPFVGLVVAGEPAGDRFGGGDGPPAFDLALDLLEGTSYLAADATGALAAIALAPRGTLLAPGPCHYMEKFVAPAAAREAIEPAMPLAEKLHRLAERLGRRPRELTVHLLEKPRHRRLAAEIEAVGARLLPSPAGDLAGAVAAALPDSGIDALVGTGGAVEGVIAACAVRALGGCFFARLDPQLAGERARVREAGLDTGRWYRVEELVATRDVLFCATGITDGLLLAGVRHEHGRCRTRTLMISGDGGERHLLDTCFADDRPSGETGR